MKKADCKLCEKTFEFDINDTYYNNYENSDGLIFYWLVIECPNCHEITKV